MRSRKILKTCLAAIAAGLLVGCLVSEQQLLDAKSGKAKPLADGSYTSCNLNEDGAKVDCSNFMLTRRSDGAYNFDLEDEERSILRFRRVARGAYVAQSEDDGVYMYFYGFGDGKELSLVLMNCPDLPNNLRSNLIDGGDMTAEDDEFSVCKVNTMKGLVGAAKAYHRGDVDYENESVIVLSPAVDDD